MSVLSSTRGVESDTPIGRTLLSSLRTQWIVSQRRSGPKSHNLSPNGRSPVVKVKVPRMDSRDESDPRGPTFAVTRKNNNK